MPFDPINYDPPPVPRPTPRAPRLFPSRERIVLRLMAVAVLILFVLPLCVIAIVETVTYFQGL